MRLTSILQELPFAEKLSESALELLSENAAILTFENDEIITLQFSSAEQFFILYTGKVEYHLNVGDQRGALVVGENDERGTPIGWSGFREPYRFATTAKAKGTTKVVAWDNTLLRALFNNQPQIGVIFLSSTLLYSTHLLRDARKAWTKGSIPLSVSTIEGNSYMSFQDKGPVESDLEFFHQIPFFNPFSDWDLLKLAQISSTKYYKKGEKLLSKGEKSALFMVLKSGKVSLSFVSENGERYTSDILEERGQVVLWSAASFDTIPNDMELVVIEPVEVLEIQRADLLALYDEFPNLGMVFMYRLLWLLGSALKAIRAQVITQTYDRELLTIQTMIDQAGAQLSVCSALHKIPYLLTEKLTQGIAFDLLDNLSSSGIGIERSLANLFVKVTTPLRKEYYFLEGIKKMTNHVIQSPQNTSPKVLRDECSKLFEKAITYIDVKIDGLENLPLESGNIFIYNHLLNHPYYTLPNNFQITLDSHFISMLLYKNYKDAGLRVVRVGKGPEYGHQDYYNKLGHLGVRTADSDPTSLSKEEQKEIRLAFFNEASEKLKKGTNLILSPEGTSRETHQSPVDFKPGAFMIANHSEIDPLIVPIALAFFDKRVSKTQLGVVIKPPFRLSEVIDQSKPFKEELRTFLKSYSKSYRSYVEEAIHLVKKK